MSFLDSRKIVPLESGLIIGETRSVFKNLSLGILADLSHSFILPHISALLLPYIMGLLDLLPKLTPLILYLCSLRRSTMPAPRPPSSITTKVGLNSSMASIMWPTTVMVSSPRCRSMRTISLPCRTAITVASAPNLAGSTPMMIGAVWSLYLALSIASSTMFDGINWSSPALGNWP